MSNVNSCDGQSLLSEKPKEASNTEPQPPPTQLKRLVSKKGLMKVEKVRVSKRNQKYAKDFITTLVDLPWILLVIFFIAAFVVTWNVFGVIYYVIAIVHGDVNEQPDDEAWTPCFANVNDYASAVLFSFESQTTIGYGFRYINSICHPGVVFVMLQNCVGSFVHMLATGLVFVKLFSPRARAHTLMFSKSAVICSRSQEKVDESPQWQLAFRIGDMRTRSQIIGTSIRAVLIRRQSSADGHLDPFSQIPLTLHTEACPVGDNFVFLGWPITIVHRIYDDTSPLWKITEKDHFEIVVILEGTVESIGSFTQVRKSYLSQSDIVWGKRLAPLQTLPGNYEIDYSCFDVTEKDETYVEKNEESTKRRQNGTPGGRKDVIVCCRHCDQRENKQTEQNAAAPTATADRNGNSYELEVISPQKQPQPRVHVTAEKSF